MKTYECEVVSPMFAHGADPKVFDLRATEIKGAMRFWFRTALSSKLQNNIKTLKLLESYIFGNTAQKSKVMISVNGKLSPKTDPIKGESFGSKFKIDPIRYMAYGMYDSQKDKKKDKENEQWHAYAEQGIFKINLSFSSVNRDNSTNQEEIKEIESITDDVLFLLSTFGGIGAKSDKGFGSFQIKSKDYPYDSLQLEQMAKKAVDDIFEKSKSILERIEEKTEVKDLNLDPIRFEELPTYPLFDPQDSQTFGMLDLNTNDFKKALSFIGEKYYEFRRELESDGSFNNSYKDPNYKAKRAMLGLPILYQQPKPTITLKNSTGRKTSTLHMSLKRINSNYHLVYVFLPAMIGESNELIIAIEKKEGSSKQEVSSETKINSSFNLDDFDCIYNKFRKTWEAK